MISQGEVEMSLISKNFFFTFFNLFVIFTIFGTASNATAEKYRDKLGDSLKDTTSIAYTLANSLKDLVLFYINLTILQGLGLFPLRLLEFGSVALYPINLIGAKTPRGIFPFPASLIEVFRRLTMFQTMPNWYSPRCSATASTFLRAS